MAPKRSSIAVFAASCCVLVYVERSMFPLLVAQDMSLVNCCCFVHPAEAKPGLHGVIVKSMGQKIRNNMS